jgi:hypothetical protein
MQLCLRRVGEHPNPIEGRIISRFVAPKWRAPSRSAYRYVRVASDILLIAVGTGMVVDAIEDLGRM